MATTAKRQASRSRSQRSGTTRPADRSVRRVVGDAAYATVGLGNTALGLARTLPRKAGSVAVQAPKAVELAVRGRAREVPARLRQIGEAAPRQLEARLTRVRDRAERRFDTFADRGRTIVSSASDHAGTQQALSQARTARSQIKAASTSAGKAAAAGAHAASATVETAATAAEREQYEALGVDELRELAAARDVAGRAQMTKDELVAALLRS